VVILDPIGAVFQADESGGGRPCSHFGQREVLPNNRGIVLRIRRLKFLRSMQPNCNREAPKFGLKRQFERLVLGFRQNRCAEKVSWAYVDVRVSKMPADQNQNFSSSYGPGERRVMWLIRECPGMDIADGGAGRGLGAPAG